MVDIVWSPQLNSLWFLSAEVHWNLKPTKYKKRNNNTEIFWVDCICFRTLDSADRNPIASAWHILSSIHLFGACNVPKSQVCILAMCLVHRFAKFVEPCYCAACDLQQLASSQPMWWQRCCPQQKICCWGAEHYQLKPLQLGKQRPRSYQHVHTATGWRGARSSMIMRADLPTSFACQNYQCPSKAQLKWWSENRELVLAPVVFLSLLVRLQLLTRRMNLSNIIPARHLFGCCGVLSVGACLGAAWTKIFPITWSLSSQTSEHGLLIYDYLVSAQVSQLWEVPLGHSGLAISFASSLFLPPTSVPRPNPSGGEVLAGQRLRCSAQRGDSQHSNCSPGWRLPSAGGSLPVSTRMHQGVSRCSCFWPFTYFWPPLAKVSRHDLFHGHFFRRKNGEVGVLLHACEYPCRQYCISCKEHTCTCAQRHVSRWFTDVPFFGGSSCTRILKIVFHWQITNKWKTM